VLIDVANFGLSAIRSPSGAAFEIRSSLRPAPALL